MALILEVLDPRTGEVRARRRLDETPVTLGRGYDNDVVLDDPYADVFHARIARDETGAFVVEDLGSANALVADKDARQRRVTLRHGMVLRIGRTRLRFQDPEAPLPPALPDIRGSGGLPIPGWLDTWWGQLAVTGVAVCVVGWLGWMGSYERSGAADAATTALGVLIIGLMWAGGWAIASRVVVHRFRFLAHLALASAVLVLLLLYQEVVEWLAFLFPDSAIGAPVAVGFVFFLVTALVASHLTLASNLARRRCWLAGLVTSGILTGLVSVATLLEEESFSDVPEFSAALKPFPTSWLPTGTLETFKSAQADLKRQADALAAGSE